MHVLCSPLIQHFGTVWSKNTWHFRVSKANSQTKTEPVSFHWDGVIPGHLFVRRPERWGLWRRKHGRLFWSVPCLRRWRATSCLKTVRAGWANGSESNYREQGDPAGMATPTILFDEAEVSPCRCINAERDCFRNTWEGLRMTLSLSLSCTHASSQDKIQTQRKRLRKDRGVLFVHATVFFHTLWCFAPFTDRRAGNLLFTHQSWFCFVWTLSFSPD